MPKYHRTLIACYFGYISQAIINNLLPLLFVTLQNQFSLSVTQIGFMVTFNFFMQLVVDLIAAKYADKIGYRACMVIAHASCALGLAGLIPLPVFQSLYRTSSVHQHLRHWRRTYRSTGQPHCAGPSPETERIRDQHSPLFLLLGSCRCGSADHPLLLSVWQRKLASGLCTLGHCPGSEYHHVQHLPYVQTYRGRRPAALPGAV